MYSPTINPMPIGPVTVVTAGTPVRLISELITLGNCLSGDWVQVNKIFLFSLPSNSGNIYLGLQTMNKATLQGVMALIGPGGGWSITNPVGMNVYRADQMYVDADNSGEGLGGSIDQV